MMMRTRLAALVAVLLCAPVAARAATVAPVTFSHPLLPSGPDPWVAQRDGWYYYTNTLGDRIALWKTRDLTRLAEASPVVVWRAPASGPRATSVWAPELHYLGGVVSLLQRV